MEPKQVVNAFIEEVLNKKNLGAMDEIVAEDFLEQVPFPGQGPARSGLRDVLTVFINAFPDMKWRASSMKWAQAFPRGRKASVSESAGMAAMTTPVASVAAEIFAIVAM